MDKEGKVIITAFFVVVVIFFAILHGKGLLFSGSLYNHYQIEGKVVGIVPETIPINYYLLEFDNGSVFEIRGDMSKIVLNKTIIISYKVLYFGSGYDGNILENVEVI